MVGVEASLTDTVREDKFPNGDNVLPGLSQVLHLLPELVQDGE